MKRLLMVSESPTTNVFDAEITLTAYDDTYLEHTLITSGSEILKVARQASPYHDAHSPITLIENVASQLTYQKAVKGSVVVASDTILSTVYTENVDYVIDYSNGLINIGSSGSSIPSGTSVHVWYLPYTVLSRDSDYTIDYTSGAIRRLYGTTIPDGSSVMVDYAHSDYTIPDAAILEAMKRAESIIEDNLASGYSLTSGCEGLKSAAMYYTAYLLCLALACREGILARSSNAAEIAREFRIMAQSFLEIATYNFSKYLKVSSLPTAEIISNRAASPSNTRAITPPAIVTRERRY